MIKEFFLSFSESFKERVSNPFLSTYIVVWLIRNWELIYSILNFDTKLVLSEKVLYIKGFFGEQTFIENLSINIIWSFVALITTYTLLNISRLIVNIFEKQLSPWIFKITDSKSVVLKYDYDRLKTERNELQNKLNEERDAKFRLEQTIDELEKTISSQSHGDSKDYIENSNSVSTNDIQVLYLKIKEKKLVNNYVEMIANINNGKSVSQEPNIEFYLKLGLIKIASFSYDITPDGQKVFEKARKEYN